MAKNPPWTEDELEYLSENIGVIRDAAISKHLGRSLNAIHIALVRKLPGTNRRSNIYTAREVARLLGIPCAKTLIGYHKRGWIKGRRAPWSQGGNRVWIFKYEDILEFINNYPWLCRKERMETSYFNNGVLKQLWLENPWYTTEDVAKILKTKTLDSVHRYIYWGLLPAVKAPGGPWQGKWIIRGKDLDAFIASNRLKSHRRHAMLTNKRKKKLESGLAIKLYTLLAIRCPSCNKIVRIRADSKLYGPEVSQLFIQLYTGDKCRHGSSCTLLEEGVESLGIKNIKERRKNGN